MDLVDVGSDERITQVSREIFGSQAYIALDVRRQFLIMAQSCPSLMTGIHDLLGPGTVRGSICLDCNEHVRDTPGAWRAQ